MSPEYPNTHLKKTEVTGDAKTSKFFVITLHRVAVNLIYTSKSNLLLNSTQITAA